MHIIRSTSFACCAITAVRQPSDGGRRHLDDPSTVESIGFTRLPAMGSAAISQQPITTTFACHGTVTEFRIGGFAQEVYGNRVKETELERFVAFFAGYRCNPLLQARRIIGSSATKTGRACRSSDPWRTSSGFESSWSKVWTGCLIERTWEQPALRRMAEDQRTVTARAASGRRKPCTRE